jgi:hypothetical protein
VQKSGSLLNHHEVVLDKSSFYKRTLAFGNQLVEMPMKPICQDLSDKFDKTMYKAYVSEIPDMVYILFLGQQGDKSRVKKAEIPEISSPNCRNNSHDIIFNRLTIM